MVGLTMPFRIPLYPAAPYKKIQNDNIESQWGQSFDHRKDKSSPIAITDIGPDQLHGTGAPVLSAV